MYLLVGSIVILIWVFIIGQEAGSQAVRIDHVARVEDPSRKFVLLLDCL